MRLKLIEILWLLLLMLILLFFFFFFPRVFFVRIVFLDSLSFDWLLIFAVVCGKLRLLQRSELAAVDFELTSPCVHIATLTHF